MLVLTQPEIKKFSRNAMCFKNVDIQAEDGDYVDVSAHGNTIVISKKDLTEEELQSDKTTLITKEIGLFGGKSGLVNEVEIIFCEDTMIVTLLKGTLLFLQGENALYISKDSRIPNVALEDVKWVSTEHLRGLCTQNHSTASEFPYDFEFHIELSGEGVQPDPRDKQHRDYRFLGVKLLSEPADISGGLVQAIVSKRVVKERARVAAVAVKPLYTSSNENEFDPPVYDDNDDDIDEDAILMKGRRKSKKKVEDPDDM